jgi:hypothetical protein
MIKGMLTAIALVMTLMPVMVAGLARATAMKKATLMVMARAKVMATLMARAIGRAGPSSQV